MAFVPVAEALATLFGIGTASLANQVSQLNAFQSTGTSTAPPSRRPVPLGAFTKAASQAVPPLIAYATNLARTHAHNMVHQAGRAIGTGIRQSLRGRRPLPVSVRGNRKRKRTHLRVAPPGRHRGPPKKRFRRRRHVTTYVFRRRIYKRRY